MGSINSTYHKINSHNQYIHWGLLIAKLPAFGIPSSTAEVSGIPEYQQLA